jgi:hypothetical protein
MSRQYTSSSVSADLQHGMLHVVHKFVADAQHNASAITAVFNLHANATQIVNYVHSQWGERWVASIFHRALSGIRNRCDSSSSMLVLDVGANAGYYGMLALALGANVIFFDAQPTCWHFIATAVSASPHSQRAQIVRGGVSTQPYPVRIDLTAGTDAKYKAWQQECDGHFGMRGRKDVMRRHSPSPDQDGGPASRPASRAQGGASTVGYPLPTFRQGMLGDALAVGAELSFVKVDVEGAEMGILNASLLPLMRDRRVRHLVMEASPGFWNGSLGHTHSLAFALDVIGEVIQIGYTMETRLLRKQCARHGARAQGGAVTAPMVAGGRNGGRGGEHAGGPRQAGCWLWQPASAQHYVKRMAYAEDLHFERIGPLRMTRVPSLDLGAGAKAGASTNLCDSHSFELETGASLADIEKLRARAFQPLSPL